LPEIGQVIGRAVGEGLIGLCPDILRRIEFRRVCREGVDMQARVLGEERLDFTTPVDRAAVPEQVDGAVQVSEKMVEKGPDVEAGEIVRATAKIERQSSPLGRQRQPTADRESVMTVAVAQTRRLSLRCPGPAQVGDK